VIGQADAAFDALSIVGGLGGPTEGILEGEVHMVDYLGFLLSVYDGQPSEQWGFAFTTTPTAAPFAAALDSAIAALRRVGLIASRASLLYATGLTRVELDRWRALPRNQRRGPYLRAAVVATKQLTLPTLARGINQEPQLRHASQTHSMRMLPDTLALGELREQFQTINNVLGEPTVPAGSPDLDKDLMVRAVLWLHYLESAATNEGEAA
jgi:hypothetical protein